jgi:hypothetical protein
VVLLLLRDFDYFEMDIIFFFLFSFLFWMCAFFMFRLALDIMLMQRLDVIDIFLFINIFPLSKKGIAGIKHNS